MLEQEREKLRLEKIRDNAKEGTQARIDAQIALDTYLEDSRQKNIENDKAIEGERQAFLKEQRDALALSEDERNALEIEKTQQKYDALIEKAIEYGEDVKALEEAKERAVNDIKEKWRQEDIASEIAIEEAKRNQRQRTLDNVIAIAGQETAVGKAALVAKQLLLAKELVMNIQSDIQAAISSARKATIRGAEAGADIAAGGAKAVSSLPPPFNIPIIIAYAAQAVGIISSIKKAVSKSKALAKGGGGSAPSISAPSAPKGRVSIPKQQAPDFNVVGQSKSSQIADAVSSRLGGNLGNRIDNSISGQTSSLQQQPIKAYVVTKDITSGQELDNNAVKGASLG